MTAATASPAPRPSFAILVAISAIGPLALNLFIPSMPGLEKTFAVPYGTVQLTLTLYLIGMAVCQLIYGPASDKFGRRPMLLAGLSLFFIASVLAAIAPTIETLIAARLIQAIGGSAGIVLARAMVRDVFTREKSASMISYITMAFVVAPMIAPVLGGFLEQYASWRVGFWLLAGFGAIVLAPPGSPCRKPMWPAAPTRRISSATPAISSSCAASAPTRSPSASPPASSSPSSAARPTS